MNSVRARQIITMTDEELMHVSRKELLELASACAQEASRLMRVAQLLKDAEQ